MDQAAVNAAMQPWGDVDIRRFTLRVAMFKRRRVPEVQAERWADRLALRDQQLDDRRSCIECKHLSDDGSCFCARQGWIRSASKLHHPVVFLLQRCERFSWATP